MKVAVVVEVAMVISPSTPTSVTDCRNAASEDIGIASSTRRRRMSRTTLLDRRLRDSDVAGRQFRRF